MSATADSSTHSSGTRESLLSRARRQDADAWRDLVESIEGYPGVGWQSVVDRSAIETARAAACLWL